MTFSLNNEWRRRRVWLVMIISFFAILSLNVLTLNAGEEKGSTPAAKPTSDKKSPKAVPKPTEEQQTTQMVKGTYIHLPAFRIPVIQNRTHRSNILLDITLEAPSPEQAIKLYKICPLLVDVILMDLWGTFALVWTPNYHIELNDLKKRLQKVTSKIVGKSLLKDVLVQSFTTQLQKYDEME